MLADRQANDGRRDKAARDVAPGERREIVVAVREPLHDKAEAGSDEPLAVRRADIRPHSTVGRRPKEHRRSTGQRIRPDVDRIDAGPRVRVQICRPARHSERLRDVLL